MPVRMKYLISDYQKHILFELLAQDRGYEEACRLYEEACNNHPLLETAAIETNNILEYR
jgi:hypothetical protein